ncbi:MAG TPA: autotransporter-associated beta strand repeat-containing protein [Caulobacteraceae bacterium]
MSFYFQADFSIPPSNITAGNTYLASNLGSTVYPVFQGGTLQTDQLDGLYAQNFTLDGSGTNTIDQVGNASTFTGVLSDATPGTPGSIIIANSLFGGSVTFTGVNAYTGSTTINSGATLALAGSGSIATSSGVAANGTFDISQVIGGASITSLSGSGLVDLGAQTLTLTGASGTFSGVIADGGIGGGVGGNLVLAGGTETLAGVNIYTGSTTIDSGATLALAGSGSIATSSGVAANGTFDISQVIGGASITSLSGSGAVALGGQTLTLTGASGTFSGVIADGGIGGGTGGSLVLSGGTETLTGVNTYTGFTSIGAGATLALSGSGSIAASSVLNVDPGGTFDISQATSGASITNLGGSGVVDLGSQTLTLTGPDTVFFGVLADGGIGGGVGGGLTVASGIEGLAGVNTYTGATTINSGAILLLWGSTGSIAQSSGVAANGTFDISSATSGASIASLSGSGAVALGGQTLTLTNASGTFSGAIADGGYSGGTGGSLILAGGTETLTGVNTYTGSTTINSGPTLALAGSGSIATSSGVNVNAGGTFDISQTTSGALITNLGGYGTVDLGSQTLTLTDPSTAFFGVLADGGIGGGTGGGLTIAGGITGLVGVNTYTGATTIDSGATLVLGLAGSIAQSSGVAANGTFDISPTTSGASITSLSGSGVAALGGQTLTLTKASGTFSGVIADGGYFGGTGGSLVLAGGAETLTGVNTYTGSTTINSGATLALAGSGSIATSSGVTANGTFDISQSTGFVSVASLSGSGAVDLGNKTLTLTSASGTFSGVISDAGIGSGTGFGGSLTIAGGTETLAGANTYTFQTYVGSGATLALAGTGSIADSLTVEVNGALDISQTTSGALIRNLQNTSPGTVYLGSQTLTLISGISSFSGVIADGGIGGGTGGSVVLAGGYGIQTLAGVNTYTGSTTINSGATLALGGSGSIATSSGVADDGVFDISQTTSGASITSLSGSGAVDLGGKTLTLTGGSGTFSGAISDGGIGGGTGGGLVIASGTETLTGSNTYTGSTAINSGATLALGGSGSIAASSGVTANGTLDISATTSGASVAGLSGSGAVALGGQTLTISKANGTFSGVISGGTLGGLTIAGGTEMLTGVNSYAGATTINSGATLALVGSGSIASSAVTANGTFDITQTAGASIASLSGSGAVDLGGHTLTLASASGTFTGVISDSGVGGNSVGTVTVASGTQVLTGNNTYTGNSAIAAGATLQVGNGGPAGSLAGNVADAGTLVFDRAGTVVYSGVVFGTGNVTQGGPGTTILDGVNTITGVTTVQAGVLEVGDASHSNASLAGNVVVGAAGTLRGHGTIAGSVTNTAGGTVAPGGTIGTLTVGSYTQGATSTLAIEVSPTAASELNVLGAASLNGKLALTFDPGVYGAHAVYQIISAASLTGTFSSVTEGGSVPGGGLVYSLSYGAKQVDLMVESTGGAQIYGGVATATLDEARGFASLVADRSGDAGCADGSADAKTRDCTMGAWAQAIASTDNVGTAASGFGFNNTGAGAMGGLDRRVGDNATVGVAFGFEQNDLRMGGASATASGSSYFGSVYAHWIVGPAWIDGQGFYMRSNWAVNRTVAGSGSVASNPNGGTKGFLVQASVPIGADFRPYARFTYANFDRDAVTETGLTGAGYALPLASSRTALAEAGLQWSHSWAVPGGIELRPALEMGVQNDLADQNRDVSGTLEGIADTGFTVSSVHLPPTAGVADASLKVKVSRRFELTADLRDRFSANQTDASASLGGLFRF